MICYIVLNKTIIGKVEIDRGVKLEVYFTVTLPTVLYGREIWFTNWKHMTAINEIELNDIEEISGGTRCDIVRDEQIRSNLNQIIVKERIEKKNWNGMVIWEGWNQIDYQRR